MNAYIEICPMGAVRMTQKSKYVSKPAIAYMNYKQEIGWKLRELFPTPTEKAVAVNVTFWMPIPMGKSKKQQKELIGKPHQVKPDIDNLLKGAFDAANKIVWKDDNLVVRCTVEKKYGVTPGIEFQVEEIA